MDKFFKLILILSIINATLGFYERGDVVNLTPSSFKSKVLGSDDIWIVEFYAPWCGHCKNLVPEYSTAARALKGFVNVGAIDADEHKDLAQQYGIKGFPTIKIFGASKKNPTDYAGARTANGIVEFALQEIKKIVNQRFKKTKVIELTDNNFANEVLKSKDVWLVEFYAPWCGHCQRLKPIWEETAIELADKVKVGALDATVHSEISQKYQIKGFPTIKVFVNGKYEDYNGGRSKEEIVNFALDKLDANAPAPEIVELTSETDFKNNCESSQLCVISVLPHILDCDSKCRNNYLDVLKKISEKFKKNQWAYLWTEAVQQPNLEDALGLGGFGYPAMAAINSRKLKYTLLKGPFSFDGINEFLRDLSFGKGSSIPINGAKLPKILKVDAWDGKDGQLPVIDDEGITHEDL